MKDALGYYEVLQVSTDADFETIKHSYRDLAKIWHPDSNHDERATDIFQKLSRAYDVVGNPQNRLVYDILSLVYNKENYPDIDSIAPYSDDDEGVDVCVVDLTEVISKIIGYKRSQKYKIATYKTALKLNAKVSLVNWLIGWWHHKGLFLNIKAISNNFKNPVSKQETLKIMLHNMIAYAKTSQNILSAKCAVRAKSMLSEQERKLVDEYISSLNVKVAPPKKWNEQGLKLSQLIVPTVLILALIIRVFGGNISESDMWKLFERKGSINYYQTVKTGYGESVDDVVVGKVISIPVNKSDDSQLYHLVEDTKIMYGPSDDFDVMKNISEGTTVRLTGITPDKKWARIMIDNGETGFVHHDVIKQGIGNEIPYESSIIE